MPVVRLTVETGTVTVIAAIVDLVFYLKEHNGLHQVSGVILCKLYSNTLLVLFNNRLANSNKTYVSGDASGVSFRPGTDRFANTVTDRFAMADVLPDFPLESMKFSANANFEQSVSTEKGAAAV